MTQKLRTFDITDDPNVIFSAIDTHGGVIVRNFIPSGLRNSIAAELAVHVNRQRAGLPGNDIKTCVAGTNTKRFTGLAAKAPSFAQVIDHDLMHRWAIHKLPADYWLNTGHAIIVGPQSTDQPLHRDFGAWPSAEALGKSGPETSIGIMLAISDFTSENGATRIVPGSQAWDDYTLEADPSDVVQAVMPAGSALLYTGRVLHGSGANTTTDQWRFGIQMSFVNCEFTPDEANCLTVPWEIAQRYSERVQHMLGFYSLRSVIPECVTLWQADMRDVRDTLSPPPRKPYVTGAAAKMRNPNAVTLDYIRKQLI